MLDTECITEPVGAAGFEVVMQQQSESRTRINETGWNMWKITTRTRSAASTEPNSSPHPFMYSYVRILLESRRLGVLNRRNRAGCRTIALHFSQLAVFLLPNFVSFVLTVLHKRQVVSGEAKERCAVVIFTFFSLAQCVAPIIYGLRKEELVEQLEHRFPCCSRYIKNVLGWTVLANRTHTHQQTR